MHPLQTGIFNDVTSLESRWCSQVYCKILATVKILETSCNFFSTWASHNKKCKRKAEFGTRLSIKFHLTWAVLYWEKAKATVKISETLLPLSWRSGALPWSPAWSCRGCPTCSTCRFSSSVLTTSTLPPRGVPCPGRCRSFPTLRGFIIPLQWPFLEDEQFFNFTSRVSFIYPSPAC